jgi:copper chaperone CopZ
MTHTLSYSVPDIHCAHCERAINAEVSNVAGVARVDVDLATKLVTVTGDGVSDQAVREAIDEAGYEAL